MIESLFGWLDGRATAASEECGKLRLATAAIGASAPGDVVGRTMVHISVRAGVDVQAATLGWTW